MVQYHHNWTLLHQIVHSGHRIYHSIALRTWVLKISIFKAAILDSENAKPLASSHPGKMSSIPLELIQKAKKRLLPNIARFHACASGLFLPYLIVSIIIMTSTVHAFMLRPSLSKASCHSTTTLCNSSVFANIYVNHIHNISPIILLSWHFRRHNRMLQSTHRWT